MQLLSFEADRIRVQAGNRVVLSWNIPGAQRAVLVSNDTSFGSFFGDQAALGTFAVFPSQTAKFTIEVTSVDDPRRVLARESITIFVEPQTSQISALARLDPPTLIRGDEAILSWTTQGASSLEIFSSEGEVDISASSITRGSVRVRPNRSQTYTIRAKNDLGEVYDTFVEARVTDPPEILLFRVEPPSVRPGEAATLIWQTQGATRVRIWDEVREIAVLDAQADQSTRSVSTVRTTRYRLIAERDGVQTQAEATLTINPPPTVISFRAEPETIVAGEETSLVWDVIQADDVRIWDSEGNLLPISPEDLASQRVAIAPQRSQPYRLEATNPSGTATADATVSVFDPIEIVRFNASRTSILRGESTTLSWETRGATAIVLRSSSGERLDVPEGLLNGSLNVSPSERTTFILEALGPAGRVSRSVEVDVDDLFEIVELNVTPDLISPGEEAILTWRTTGGARWTLNAFPALNAPPQQGTDNAGALAVSPQETTVYVFRLISADGSQEISQSVTLSVFDAVGIVRFDSSAQRVFAGDSVTLSWETLNATQIQLVRGGVAQNVPPTGSIVVDDLQETSTWTLVAQSANGVVSRNLTVEVVQPVVPEILAFGALEGTQVLSGDVITFDWDMRDAISAKIVWESPEGEDVELPISIGDLNRPSIPYNDNPTKGTQYRLEAQGLGGTRAEASFEISVLPHIDIQSFEITPDTGAVGALYTLTWDVEGATSLLLEQQVGLETSTVDLSDRLPAGQWEVFLDETTRFTLRASNPLDMGTESLVAIVGDPIPLLDLFEIQPRTVQIDQAALSTWSVRNASTVTLEARDDLGELVWEEVWESGEFLQGSPVEFVLPPAVSPLRVLLRVRGLNNEEISQVIDLQLDPGDPTGVRLSEVLYDVLGDDAEQQWIELRHDGDVAASLWDVTMGWGGGSFVRWETELRGVIRPGECVVIGGPISSNANGNPTYRATLPFAPVLEDADLGPRADGVALFTPDQRPLSVLSVPLDSVVYGDAIDPADAWGTREVPDVSAAPTTRSIVYDHARNAWFVAPRPTPGLCFGLTDDAAPVGAPFLQDPQVLQGRRRGGELGGEILAFSGFGLAERDIDVFFGASGATCVQDASNATPLLCQVPPGTGTVDLTLRSEGGDVVYPAWYAYEPLDRCTLEPPHTLVEQTGALHIFSGRVLEPGLSNGADPSANLHVQLGIGPFGSDPSYAQDLWTWVDMVPSVLCSDCDDDARFQTDPIPLPGPGSFSFVVRARPRSATEWTYCDSNSTIYDDLSIPNGFSLDRMGTLLSEE